MRVYFVTADVLKAKDLETVKVQLRRMSESQHALGMNIQWSRTTGGEWGTPVVSMAADMSDHTRAWQFWHKLTTFINNSKVDVNNPDAFLFRLEKAGAVHAVWDPRVKKMTPVSELDADAVSWEETLTGLKISVTAEDEAGARTKITKKVQDAMAAQPDSANVLAAWFTGGLKVKRVGGGGEAPKYSSLSNYLPRHAKGARELAAQEEAAKKKTEGGAGE